MKQIPITLVCSFMIVCLIVGMLFGYYISPTYQQTMYEKEEMNLGVADKFVDLRYINQMAKHHRGAILLAEQIANKSQRQEVNDFVFSIQESEPKLIKELYDWKKEWYKDSRVEKDPVVVNLGEADEKIDLRFFNSLIAHHESGITMTQEIRTKSSRKEILDNADAVENLLKNGIVLLKNWRANWYGVN